MANKKAVELIYGNNRLLTEEQSLFDKIRKFMNFLQSTRFADTIC